MAEQVDVLICGSGSAGLCAATWLSRCGVRCKIIDSRSGPLIMGQADGVQCRTVEVFESFGLSEELLRDAYHVLETVFWSSDKNGGIVRRSRTVSTHESPFPSLGNMPCFESYTSWVSKRWPCNSVGRYHARTVTSTTRDLESSSNECTFARRNGSFQWSRSWLWL